MRAVISLSGGMDSTGLLLHFLNAGYKVSALSFNYGQKHNIELERAKANIEYLKSKGQLVDHEIIDVSQIGSLFTSALVSNDIDVPEGHYEQDNMKATVVPNRNMIFFSIVAGYALSIALREDCDVDIGLGVHSGDHEIYPDCRPEFYVRVMESFVIGNWDNEKVNLKLPFLNGNKTTILEDALISCLHLELDFDTVFANTNTSYDPDEKGRASGKTGADVERILAFDEIGRPDPVEYVDDWDTVLANAKKVEQEWNEK